MCDKMSISTYIMKIAENDPFLRLQMRAIECLIVTNLFSSNKQYVEIELMQNETNRWSISFSKGEILIEMIKNVCISLIFRYCLCVGKNWRRLNISLALI